MFLYEIALFILIFLSFRYIKQWQIEGLSPWTLPLAFAIKSLVGVYFIFVYTVYYGEGTLSADAGQFMKESRLLYNVFFEDKGAYFRLLFGFEDSNEMIHHYLSDTSHWDVTQSTVNDNRNILRIHSLIHFISFNRSFVHVLVVCFITMFGVKQLFLAFRPYTTLKDTWLFWLLFLIPSVLFWTSGILKEPFLFVGLALLARGLLTPLRLQRRVLITLSGMFLLMVFKPYVLLALLPALSYFAIYSLLPKYKIWGAFGILIFTGISLVYFLEGPRQRLTDTISRKQFDFINVARGGVHAYTDSCFYFFEPGQYSKLEIDSQFVCVREPVTAKRIEYGSIDSPTTVLLHPSDNAMINYFQNDQCEGYIPIRRINNSFERLIYAIPEALMNVLFRPFWNDPGGWHIYPAIAEITVLWLLLLLAIRRRRKLTEREHALLISILLFCLTLATIIGLVTPVLGAIVRYRIPVLIALFFIIILLYESPKKLSRYA